MNIEHIEIYRSKKNKQFGWRYIAKNGRRVACGGETYYNRKDATDMVRHLFAEKLASGSVIIVDNK